ncbi:MAG: sensor histidine kinase [Deltaproteobacteria bacterium]|nr:MAG: sensor histidine kinase [Deltaproteobacteria bacterium]
MTAGRFSLHARVAIGVVGLLVGTVLLAWLVAGGAVLGPLLGALSDERADAAAYIAREVRSAEDPRQRARELADELGVQLRLVDHPPHRLRGGPPPPTIERDGVTMIFAAGRRGPVLVPMGDGGGPPYLAIHFRTDLDRPQRRIGLALLMLAAVGVVAGVLASRWMLRPLEVAGDAMARIADGDLSHRVADEGGDAAARIGRIFNRMADRVQGMVEGQRELMAAISHELRTPLARMRLQAELLREQGADERRVAALEADIAEVDDLIGELLESARLHQGMLALHREPVSVRALVDEVLAEGLQGDRPVDLHIPDGLQVHADRSRLARALRNLLQNVGRYTPESTPVAITASTEDDGVHIVVADRGPGVPDDALARLFDPFFRAEQSRSRSTGGLGLGLMLVRQVAEAHGGRVAARNRSGGGLEVELVLPAAAT